VIRLVQHDTHEEEVELLCFDQKSDRLDGFGLYLNTFIYLLQRVCGFQLRAFLVNSMGEGDEGVLGVMDRIGIDLVPDKPVQDIYLFLSLSTENMLRAGSRYAVKKEIDYSIFDFHLNDPTTRDQRPVRLHSELKGDKRRQEEIKRLERFFKIKEMNNLKTDIIEEKEISCLEYQKFLSYWEESFQIFDFIRSRMTEEVDNQEDVYLFEYNRGKLNAGCRKEYARQNKRRLYYELQKNILQKHGYPCMDDPPFLEDFQANHQRGGFFDKLRGILKYRPTACSPYGDMVLFNSMERTKLCYLQLKSTFKINQLQQHLGFEFVALNNDFEKWGEEGLSRAVRRGLGSFYLAERWYSFGAFSDIRTIRSYMGDVIAHQVMIKVAVLVYLFAISVPYGMLYIF
jgi:hypothetical protein